ncbi:MAG: ABC transporter substrate-binding protein [Betaproteobacteria bacterium]|nr:ABC transporter substrate-binding protein [Betaproteobacteria bacterium]
MNQRRKLLVVLGASLLATPFGSFAQKPGKVWRVGFLGPRKIVDVDTDVHFGAFRPAMRALGYVEGKNLIVEWRFADGKVERLPGLARELVNLKVDVIVAVATPSTLAAQKATTTIPIVMVNIGDPVGQGFARTLSHPGGNITGLSIMSGEFGPKHLEMLLSAAPKVSRVSVLMNRENAIHATLLKEVEAAAAKRNVKILPVEARTPEDIDKAFGAMAKEKSQAFIVAQHPIFIQQTGQIAQLAAKNRLPSIAGTREYAEAGGLISYGASNADGFRRSASYVDKIFKGAKPADLPVEQPTKFELVINRKTAKALGLTIPQSLLISADRVID